MSPVNAAAERDRRPILGVGGLVFDGRRVLLVKRGAPPTKGFWSIPGGKLRRGELIVRAVEREMLEETGLRVRVGELVAVYEKLPRAYPGGGARHFVVLDYLCEPIGGSLQAGDDAAEAEWFSVDELGALRMTPGAAEVVRRGMAVAERADHRWE